MYTWTAASDGQIPPGAAQAGTDSGGQALYVARAGYLGGLQIGKVRPEFGAAYIPYGGREVAVAIYEVLMDAGAWYPAFDEEILETGGAVPPAYGIPPVYGYAVSTGFLSAVVSGFEADGTPLYAVRAEYHGLQPGKVRLPFSGADISYGGAEVMGLNPYEVLVDGFHAWSSGSNGSIPAGSVQGNLPNPGNAGTQYIARMYVNNDLGTGLQLGKVGSSTGATADIPYGGREYQVSDYEVLGAGTFTWIAAQNGSVPDGALALGYEGDGTPLFAARADYAGGLHLGKVRPGLDGASIGYNGVEYFINPYEVLVSSP
jgi:hypothetical protein